jgi:hypothetical protein
MKMKDEMKDEMKTPPVGSHWVHKDRTSRAIVQKSEESVTFERLCRMQIDTVTLPREEFLSSYNEVHLTRERA